MPLAKYHCDYCNKEFQDTSFNRRRHLQGVQHQRAKAQWYDSFKEPNQSQSQSLGKGICNHFVRKFGDSCRYYHPKQNTQMPTTEGIIENVAESVQSPIITANQLIGDVSRDGMKISLGNLPPSLRPPSDGGYPSLPFVNWG
ncbi:hypothetical protein GIB67_011285 [Kingdonia uniflora]|uniref:U1-C C2H2-type zinc finger domain-containing protein n=1 Tax=Kingdonia uniflora TaxID=39325 RepID=A0A7J7MNS7_9MAGN|nr:hypothetical protein GIB67_011285 [Kingdonia uniflora]